MKIYKHYVAFNVEVRVGEKPSQLIEQMTVNYHTEKERLM